MVAVERNERERKWLVTTRPTSTANASPERHLFDRLIVATGANGKPTMPVFAGVGRFEGDILHSQQFKDASRFKGKTIVVVGSSATAADAIEFLKAAGAKKIYMSHKRSPMLLPATIKGKALDHVFTRRTTLTGAFINTISPALGAYVTEKFLRSLQDTAWPTLKVRGEVTAAISMLTNMLARTTQRLRRADLLHRSSPRFPLRPIHSH